MSNQGIKSDGSYYQTSLNDGSLACVNLSKTYDKINKAQTKYGFSGNTTGLSTKDQIAYIKMFRKENPDIAKKWSEAQMLREMKYHDAAYNISESLGDIFGISDNCIKVDFEEDIKLITYMRRIIGNLLW